MPDCIERVKNDGNKQFTALMFLEFLLHLREVILQDVAILFDEDDPVPHQIFQQEIFQSEDFETYRNDMRHHILASVEPTDLCIDQCLPGINSHFQNALRRIDELDSQVKNNNNILLDRVLPLLDGIKTDYNQLLSGIHRSVRALGSTFEPTQGGGEGSAAPLPAIYDVGTNSTSRSRHHLTMPPGAGAVFSVDGARFSSKPVSFAILLEEWYGIGSFVDIPCCGGFANLEEVRKGSWRTTYQIKEKQRFSKIKRIVEVYASQLSEREKCEVLVEFEHMWTESGRNWSPMIERLQNEGYLTKHKRNKRNNDVVLI